MHNKVIDGGIIVVFLPHQKEAIVRYYESKNDFRSKWIANTLPGVCNADSHVYMSETLFHEGYISPTPEHVRRRLEETATFEDAINDAGHDLSALIVIEDEHDVADILQDRRCKPSVIQKVTEIAERLGWIDEVDTEDTPTIQLISVLKRKPTPEDGELVVRDGWGSWDTGSVLEDGTFCNDDGYCRMDMEDITHWGKLPNTDVLFHDIATSTDQSFLISKLDGPWYIRQAVIKRIEDKDIIHKVATSDKYWQVRREATKKITDTSILSSIAINDTSGIVKDAAISRITDKETLLLLLNNDKNEGVVRPLAEEQLKNLFNCI